jgi:hypothetical protein
VAISDADVAVTTLGDGHVVIVYHTKTEDDDAHGEDARDTSASHHMAVGDCGVVVAGIDVVMATKLAILVDGIPDTLGYDTDF